MSDGELTLYRDEAGVFMIRVNGYELMNGHCHRSEIVLGELAVRLAPAQAPRILLGGLGLGFTLKAAARLLPDNGRIEQVELSQQVIDWFHRYFAPEFAAVNVTIIAGDVATRLDSQYDVIALDIDNGPDPLTTQSNGGLYSREGLLRLKAALKPSGKLIIWSAFSSPAFVALGKECGFHAGELPVPAGIRPDFLHTLFIFSLAQLTRGEAASVNRERAMRSADNR